MTNKFQPAPKGTIDAVCIDVIDLGVRPTPWGDKHQEKLVFEIDAVKENGYRFIVSRIVNISNHEKSTRRMLLDKWLAQSSSQIAIARGIRGQSLIGMPARIVLKHVEKYGQTYINIKEILPAGSTHLKPSGKYNRWENN